MTTVELPYPPSVNYTFSVIRGRPVLTKEVRAFRQRVRTCVRDGKAKVGLGPLAVRLELQPPDNRRRDCDNAQKPILDALQQAGLYFDDSQIVWLLTVKLAPTPGGRVVARIHSLDDGPLPPGLANLDHTEEQA
jgi:crossover junction endodeoxyribonuclease RusA